MEVIFLEDLRGIEYLRQKLNMHSRRVEIRYSQYDMKYMDNDPGITIPAQLRVAYRSTLGWCAKAVDCLADRLIFREFDNDEFEVNEVFYLNNPDVFFDSAILSALIGSCCFVYISADEDGNPRLQVIDAANATGVIDPITGLLKEGYAVLKRDDRGSAILEAYFEPYRTTVINHSVKTAAGNKTISTVFKHEVGYPLLVPIIHRPDAVRPFGRSRISRSSMYHQKYAKRVLERADITAEFYSFPQKYILGMESSAEAWDSWKATISTMLRIDKDSDGDHPIVGQFTTSSMSPFTEQLRTAAACFAGETGLTLDDLGFVSDNPSSSEAIKASHETLRVMARKAQRCFGSGFLNVGYLAVCLRDKFNYKRNQFYNLIPKWEPVFEADASTLSLVGDGAIKINQAIPGYITGETIRDLTGIDGEEVVPTVDNGINVNISRLDEKSEDVR